MIHCKSHRCEQFSPTWSSSKHLINKSFDDKSKWWSNKGLPMMTNQDFDGDGVGNSDDIFQGKIVPTDHIFKGECWSLSASETSPTTLLARSTRQRHWNSTKILDAAVVLMRIGCQRLFWIAPRDIATPQMKGFTFLKMLWASQVLVCADWVEALLHGYRIVMK